MAVGGPLEESHLTFYLFVCLFECGLAIDALPASLVDDQIHIKKIRKRHFVFYPNREFDMNRIKKKMGP